MSLALKAQLRTREATWCLPVRVPLRPLALFTRQLAVMYRAGIPVVKALKGLTHQTEDDRLAFIIQGLLWQVKKGLSLSESLKSYPDTFSPIYVAFIKEGESTSDLDRALEKAALLLEEEWATRQRLKAALSYPLFVLVVGLGAGFVSLRMLAPVLTEIFHGIKVLPWPSRLLLSVCAIFENGWYSLGTVLIPGLLLILTWRFLRAGRGRYHWDYLLLVNPLTASLTRQLVLGRVARTLAASMRSGVPLTQVLTLCSEVAGNEIFRRDLLRGRQALIDGIPLDQFFRRRKRLYTPAFCAMVMVGNEVGDLASVGDRLAEMFEIGAAARLETAVALLQPALVGLMGLLIGFLGLAVLMPVYQMV